MCHVLCNTLGEGKELSKSFQLSKKQFHLIYRRRLENLTSLIQTNFEKLQIQESITKSPVTHVTESTKSFIIGNVVRQSQLFMTTVDESVLSEKEYNKKVQLNKDFDQIGTLEDQLYLEDLTGRVLLNFPKDSDIVRTMITGLTLGLIGYSDTSGEFLVEEVVYPFNISKEIVEKTESDFKKAREDEETILFISSLNLKHTGKEYKETLYNLKMLICNACEQFNNLNVVISGPIINHSYMDELSTTNYMSQDKEVGAIAEQLRHLFTDLDELFLSVLKRPTVNIYIQPGINDPTDNTYPVPALCSFFFAKTLEFTKNNPEHGNLYALSNPDFINIKGNKIVMNCGSNIKDYYRNCCSKNVHQICLGIIKSALNIPTCPMYSDSKVCLDCEDFITMKETADMYVFGKAENFECFTTKEFNKEITVLRIEEFYKTNKACLFGIESKNLHIFECYSKKQIN